MSIPNFPAFKPLLLEDKKAIESWIMSHPPYSDFNFTSMWTWDTNRTMLVSQLNNNLVVIFSDYLTADRFFSFIGTEKIEETIHDLLMYRSYFQVSTEFKLIPESVINSFQKKNTFNKILKIEEDDTNHDYVLSIEKMLTMSGKKLGPKRNFINRFKKKYGDSTVVKELNFRDSSTKKDILDLFCLWQKKAQKTCQETDDEYKAIIRTLENYIEFNLCGVGVYVNDKLSAFSIDEVLHDGYGIIHYEKADIDKIGIYQFLKQQCAKMLYEKGCKFINYEQDLGIQGLRKAKRSHDPVDMLKKYKIKFLNPDYK